MMLQLLHSYRGLAALMIVVYHADLLIWRAPQYFGRPLASFLDFFDSGVQLFFVLSGFIIFRVHKGDLNKPNRIVPFFIKRFIRIYPIYLIVLSIVILLFSIFPNLGNGIDRSASNILTSFLLVPYPSDPVHAVAWTLKQEIFFYGVFSILILNFSLGTLVFFLWQAGCVISLAWHGEFPMTFIFSSNNFLFLFGICVAIATDVARIKHPVAFVLFGIALIIVTGLQKSFSGGSLAPSFYILGYGFAGAAIIAGLVEVERSSKVRLPAALAISGDASYSIYLTHTPALSLAAKLLFASGAATILPQGVSFFLVVLAATLAGVAFHFVVERPLTADLRRRFRGLLQSKSARQELIAGAPIPAREGVRC